MNKINSLYVHIPFCERLCSYCDFPKYLSSLNLEDKYLKALFLELDSIAKQNLKTIYIGGGTPSSLKEDNLNSLLSFLYEKFKGSEEFSIEANPESLSDEKIEILKANNVNRVSLGAQSFSSEILSILNRTNCNKDLVISRIRALKHSGIDNINVDFIYGLKIEKYEELEEQIKICRQEGVKHISIYSLQIEENTPLFYKKDIVKDQDGLSDTYEFLNKVLLKYGYKRYEVSNFSLEGYQSRHNLTYWRNKEYYACGLGATSLINSIREVRTRNIFDYIESKNVIVSSIKEDKEDREFNYLMLNLRLECGFKLEEFRKLFNKDFLISYKNEMENLKDFFEITSTSVKVKNEYLYILDSLLVDLLHFKN